MPHVVDLSGLGRLQERLRRVARPTQADYQPLGLAWSKIIDDDNRRGVLAGLDKDGAPMIPVTYRPIGPKAKRPTLRQKNTANSRLRRGAFGGFGPQLSGLNNNLTPAEYRQLGGPPLAPRGAFSRVITNLLFRWGEAAISLGTFQVVGYWDQVVSASGIPFLKAHFTGATVGRGGSVKLPKRDLRGVRPEGREKARRSLRAWAIDLIRTA